jgi:hypothetical protein
MNSKWWDTRGARLVLSTHPMRFDLAVALRPLHGALLLSPTHWKLTASYGFSAGHTMQASVQHDMQSAASEVSLLQLHLPLCGLST